MNYDEINKFFFEMEEKHKFFDYEIKGLCIRELIRFNLNSYIKIKKGTIKEPHKPQINTKIILNTFSRIINSFLFKNIIFSKKKCIFIFGHSRRQLINGKYTDIYTDLIKNKLQLKNIKFQDFEGFYRSKTSPKAKTSKNIKSYDLIEIIPLFLKRTIFFNETEKKTIKKIQNIIEEEFSITLNLKKIISTTTIRFKFYKAILNIFLSLKKPTKILEVVSYTIFNQALNSTCKKLNIPTIELQHGVIDKDHLGYSMGAQKNIKTHYSPDQLYTRGDYRNGVCNYPINLTTTSVGFPLFEESIKKYDITKQKEKNILIISQGTVGKQINEIIYNLAKALPEYAFYYKLHPGEFHKANTEFQNIKKLKNTNLILGEKTVYDLFEICKTQIGVCSTALYEGLGFGLKTTILDLPGSEYLDNLISKGFVYKSKSKEEIIKIIENKNIQNSIKKEKFFKSDAIKNILKTI